MNPLIESLLREDRLLEEGNLTWRCDRRRCEYIRPITEYIEPAYWPNYDDFLADNGDFKDKFEKHDSAVSSVEINANEFCDILLGTPIFLEQVNKSLQDYESRVNTHQPQYQSLIYMKEDLPKYVAEYLINRIKFLPHHYTMHKFWNDYAQKFELSNFDIKPSGKRPLRRINMEVSGNFKLDSESYKRRQSFLSLEQGAESLKQISSGLRRDLEDHRLMLCRKFDIPAAPPLPARNFTEDAHSIWS